MAQEPDVVAYWGAARADGTNPDYKRGVWHAVILFSAVPDEDKALSDCHSVLQDDGWDVFVVKTRHPVDSTRVLTAPDAFQAAWRGALKGGCEVLVISEPLKPKDIPKLPKEFGEQVDQAD